MSSTTTSARPGIAAARRRATSAAAAPRAERLRHEVVAVEALAAQRDEQVARRERAAVGGDARERARWRRRTRPPTRARRPSRGPSCGALQSRERRRRATCGVGERMAHAGDLLVGLVALAGDQHDVARRAPRDRGGDRRCAVELDRPAALPASRTPATIASMIAARVLAARVVAGDDDAVGEPRRRPRPSAGACPASRSPPQPNTQTSAPAGARPRAAAPRAPSRARRACARSRRRRAARRRRPGAACARAAARARASASSARSSGTPLASSAPSTPSRFDTLNAPTHARSSTSPLPHGVVDAEARCRRVRRARRRVARDVAAVATP